MILAEKIMNLRKQRGWSQEDLAEKMRVSRQSVSKWEAGQSIPDIEKVIKLGEVFEVSVDYLIKDEIEKDDSKDTKDDPEITARIVSVEEANEYMNLVRKAAKKIAGGVMAIILSVIPLIVLGGLADAGVIGKNVAPGVGMGILLIVVAMAVAVFITNGMKLGPYEYLEKEEIKLQYGVSGIVDKKKKEFAHTYRTMIAAGVVMCIAGVVPLLTAGTINASELVCVFMLGVLLAAIAVAVYVFIWAGMIQGSYNKLLQTDDYTPEKKRQNKKYAPLVSVYWCAITAVYLLISFYYGNWDKSWIIWPVAGVAFGAVMGLLSLICNKEE